MGGAEPPVRARWPTVERYRALMAKRSLWRRIERWLVGIVMAVIAIVLERMVLRSIEKKGEPTKAPPQPTSLTSRGGDVDLDEVR
jgi:hypothetical protein